MSLIALTMPWYLYFHPALCRALFVELQAF